MMGISVWQLLIILLIVVMLLGSAISGFRKSVSDGDSVTQAETVKQEIK